MIIPIVFSTDHNYVMPTGVTITSLLKTSVGNVFDIYILISTDVNNEDKNLLKQQVESIDPKSSINFIEIGNIFNNSFEIREISTACYYRLLIPWILPQYDKVIYSDVDIIFKGDISEIYDTPLDKNLVGGVNTPGFTKKRTAKYIAKLGLTPSEYINSGFIVINSKLQREENLEHTYMDLSSKKYLFQDQDIINIVCKNKIQLFDQSYNTTPREAIEKKLSVKVLHYAGAKPWKTFTLKWFEWWDIYKESLWYDEEFNNIVSMRILNRKEMIKDLWRDIKSKYFNR